MSAVMRPPSSSACPVRVVTNLRPPSATGCAKAAAATAADARNKVDRALGLMANLPANVPRPGSRIAPPALNFELLGDSEQIVLVAVLDARRDDVAGAQPAGVAEVDLAVDLGRVGLRSTGRSTGFLVDRINEHFQRLTDFGPELLSGDSRGQ